MPWFLVSPRHWHSWYCLFKVRVNWIMRGSILIILAVSSFNSDRKCTCIWAFQNEIDTHKLELYNNNWFILTIGIVRMNILLLHIPNYLYISWKVYTIFQCTEITQGDKILFNDNQGTSYLPLWLSWLLMTKRHKEPSHQKPYHWRSWTGINPAYSVKVMHTYLNHIIH